MGGKSENLRLWDFERSISHGPKKKGLADLTASLDYWNDMRKKVDRKAKAGFDTSFTDYWGLGLSQQLINAPGGGPSMETPFRWDEADEEAGYTFSSIARQPGFPDGEQPLPIIVATFRAPGQVLVPRNTTVVEYTPFETGSHDPMLFGMVATRYIGSAFEAGTVRGDQCAEGLDNAGFIMGTSSSLWNDVVLKVLDTDLPGVLSILNGALHFLADKIYKDDKDIALWNPNPFYRWNGDGRGGASARTLTLADGGEDSQNVPLHPLVQPVRALDVIFAVDSSSNTAYAWPNGSALIATQSRQRNAALANGTAFPAVPADARTFVNRGFNSRPVFFGCDPGQPTDAAPGNPPPPLIVYLANSPYTFFSNLTTFTRAVDRHTRDEMVRNGYAVVTQANSSLAPEWPACVACAALKRSFARTGQAVPQQCADCYSKYCWDGSPDDRDVGEYEPVLRAAGQAMNETRKKKSEAVGRAGGALTATVIGAAVVLGVFLGL
jgi:lysophospholipase